MKKQNEIELVGIGNIIIFPIKAEQREFELVSKDLKPLKIKKADTTEKRTARVYIDSEGKEYNEAETGRNIGGRFIQKVKRTERVTQMNIIDKANIIGNFMGEGYYIIDGDTTTIMNLDKQIGEQKALEFKYKTSTVGFKWRKAYLYKFQNMYVMTIGLGMIDEGIRQFNIQKLAVKQLEELKEIVLTTKADELEDSIEL